jgi:MinD-like ATPase involved in chromosome partitioning or flagellar assembly
MHAITFYSYKGGVGRSLLVANCALHLAQLGLRVVVLDLDLEAPGLHYKFRASLPPHFTPKRGIVDLIADYATKNELYTSLSEASFEVRLEEPLREPNEPPPRGRLYVIPAGSAPSLDYWHRVADIDWKKFLYDEDATGVEFFVDLRERIAEEFSADILLVDSRTGITEIGNVATSVLADKIVCIVADSPENLEGARAVLRGLRQHRRLSDGAPIEMKLAVSRPHASQSIVERLERVRQFFEEPAELLDATLVVDAPYPLAYAPEVEESEHLVIKSSEPGKTSQLALDYTALAEEMVPERYWEGIRTAWTPRSKSPYPYSVWNYVSFSLQQPGVPLDGLYQLGRRCSIVVPGFDASMRSLEGGTLATWFEDNKTAAVPITLVAQAPEGAVRVPDPSLEDLVGLRDHPHTNRQLDAELCLRLPRTFPAFRCAGSGGGAGMVIEIERAMGADERAVLRKAWASLGYGSTLRLATRLNPAIGKEEPKFRFPNMQGDINLVPSRRLSSVFSRAIRDLVFEDEERWMSSRRGIYRGELNEPSAVLPGWRKVHAARLLVGSGGLGMPGISKLLPFCDQLLFELPLQKDGDATFAASGFTRDDLFVLAKQGRIVLLLPQALDRYDPALLNELAEKAPEALVFSRTLCAATMIELRRRLYPWFFPNFDMRERYDRLHRAWTRTSTASAYARNSYEAALVRLLSVIWSREEWHTHEKGAMASMYLGGGLGTLLADWVQRALKRDLLIESMQAAASIERAAALGAAVVPLHRPEFSLLELTNIGAALLSIRSDSNRTMVPPIHFHLPAAGPSAIEIANHHSDELHKKRRLIADLVSGRAYPVTSALKGVIRRATRLIDVVRQEPSLSLTVTTSAYLDTVGTGYGRDATLRAMRSVVAENEQLTDSAPHDRVKQLPPIVVAVLETFHK